MSDEYVWVSDAPTESELVKGFESEMLMNDKDRTLDALRQDKKGMFVPADRFPKEMWAKYADENFEKFPDFFRASGFWTVSTDFADVLRRFDLGQTSLYPVKLLQHDRKTLIEGDHEFLNLCEKKEAFEPDYSERFKKPQSRFQKPQDQVSPIWKLTLSPKDNDISANSSALVGPDLWFDTRLTRAFSFSNRLVQALKTENLTKKMRLFKCPVIRSN